MLSRPVLLLTASIAIIGSNSLVLSPIAGAVATSFPGNDAADVMIAAAAYGLGTAFSALVFAPMADRIGAERSLLRAMGVLAAALALSAVAPGLWVLSLSQTLAGLAAGAALPAIYSLSAQIAPRGRESEVLGLVLAGWTLSLVAGVSLSALLADIVHWRGVFATLAVSAVLITLCIARTGGWGRSANGGIATSPVTALKVPGITRVLAICVAKMVAFYGLYAYFGAHVEGVLGYPTAAAGLVPLSYGIGFGAAVVFDGKIDRYGSDNVAPFAFSALALVYLAIAISAAAYGLVIAACFLWGFANHVGLNIVVGRLAALDPAQRGAIMGLYSAVTYLCVFAGTTGFRPVFETYGLEGCAFLSATLIALVAIDALARIIRQRGRAENRV